MPHFKLSKKISTFLKNFLAALLPAFALTIASLKNGAGFIFEPWQLCEIKNFFEEMILKNKNAVHQTSVCEGQTYGKCYILPFIFIFVKIYERVLTKVGYFII